MTSAALRFRGDFVGGRFLGPPRSFESWTSEDPGDLASPLGRASGSPSRVPEAVEAARRASAYWSARPPRERWKHLGAFQREIARGSADLAALITREMGKPLTESRVEVERIVDKFDSARGQETRLVEPSEHESAPGFTGRLDFRPRGVMAVLAPFNVPAYLALAPAVSAMSLGNTVVLKPSEITPFVGQRLAEMASSAGLPAGLFNVVQGTGPVGAALVAHPGVDGVIFTGSWRTGRAIRESLLDQPGKLCALEMGGKNAALVLPDADLELAASEAALGAFMTSGQRCNATSRILVHRAAAKKFLPLFLERVDALRVGYGTEPGVSMGPLASRKGFEAAKRLLAKAPREGFKILRRGGEVSATRRGYYLSPSVHLREGCLKGSPSQGRYADDEVFGPDAAIYILRDLDQMILAANRSRYGLVASVFTRSRKNFDKVWRASRTGLINWNAATTRSSSRLPFGGLGCSGNGRPAGSFSPYLCTVPTASVRREKT